MFVKTEVEAQHVLDKSIEEMRKLVCPVIGKLCMASQCAAFYPGYISQRSSVEWCVVPASCSSPMVTGVIDVTGDFYA